jgi:excinuclease ABC subunit B
MGTETRESGFELITDLKPAGDQPRAIDRILENLERGVREQVLLGVTGSGKTFTLANVIAEWGRPTLVVVHNKILAAQLYREFKELFPKNAVEYFVSYYDYYQPEAYIPEKDLYIEKDASINETLERFRHSATISVLQRRDVIVVASVSCIYGLGSPENYESLKVRFVKGMRLSLSKVIRKLVEMGYERNDYAYRRATFSVKGDALEIIPSNSEDNLVRVEVWDDEVERIVLLDVLNRHELGEFEEFTIYPASHYVAPKPTVEKALEEIERDLIERVEWFRRHGRDVEAQRLYQRTMHDIEMIREIGHCKGIENYSRYFDGRKPGEPPFTLLDYFPEDFLLIVDESHMTIPQLRAMYNGDRSRKEKLVEYGWRLPSALDNRPLKFEEFLERINQVIYVSATPGEWEMERAKGHVVEQIARPTGLLDPEVEVRPTRNQLEDLVKEIKERRSRGERALVLTTTKRLAEEVSDYLQERGIKATYMHSDLDAIERSRIVKDLREGTVEVVVGVNLLREGLDLPEVSLVAILEADKEGFLRSYTSLIQTIGRAARNVNGKAILYADRITESMRRAIEETERRREIQKRYNEAHRIEPRSVKKPVRDLLAIEDLDYVRLPTRIPKDIETEEDLIKKIDKLEKEMWEAARNWEFEKAAKLRDQIRELKKLLNLN